MVNHVINITHEAVGPPDKAPIPEGDRCVCVKEGVTEEVTTKGSNCGFSAQEHA